MTSLLTMGECWHNNHHAFPGSARLGLYAGEWDPGWWMLLVLRKAGLVWALRLPSDLPVRPELRIVDEAPLAAPPTQVIDLTRAWRLCLSSNDRGAWRCDGPAAVLPARFIRWLVGPATPFRQVPTARRFTVTAGSQIVIGLPALCVALSSRSLPARFVAVVALAPAIAAEWLRAELRYA